VNSVVKNSGTRIFLVSLTRAPVIILIV